MANSKKSLWWYSIEFDYKQPAIPITVKPSIRIHNGVFVSKKNGCVFIETTVNNDFIDGFNGIITGIKYLGKKSATGIQKAIIGIPESDVFYSEDTMKVKIINMILTDNYHNH